jgi:hypothetical protein
MAMKSAKLVPKGLGAEPKKLAILGGLLAAAAIVYWINRTPAAPEAATAPQPRPVTAPAAARSSGSRSVPPSVPMLGPRTPARGGSATLTSVEDFRPTLKLPEGADVSRIDPTLKLDLLAKVQQGPMEGARSLFEFSKPPAPPPPPVKPIKPGPETAAVKPPEIIPAKAEAAKPAAPPIPLKFYGYVNNGRGGGARRAFFLDGDDIFVAGENEMIRNRYKVVRIGVNSAVVEDTTTRNQQTLPLVEELPS